MKRAGAKLLWVSALSLFISNFALLVVPLPHLHICTLPLSFIVGPLVAWMSWRTEVVFENGSLSCPRCHRDVELPRDLEGYPARFNCVHCAIMIELVSAEPTPR